MVAEAATYGADKLWCVLKPIPVQLDSDSDPEEDLPPPTTSDEEESGDMSTGERAERAGRERYAATLDPHGTPQILRCEHSPRCPLP